MKRLFTAVILAGFILTGCASETKTGVTRENIDTTFDNNLYCMDTSPENIVFDKKSGLIYANNEVLITFNKNVSEAEALKVIESINGESVGKISFLNKYQIKLDKSRSFDDLENIVKELKQNDSIYDVDIDLIQRFSDDNFSSFLNNKKNGSEMENPPWKNDKLWEDEWGTEVGGKNWGIEAIKAPEAWLDFYDDMTEINIGVLETGGIGTSHEDVDFEEPPFNNLQQDDTTHSLMVSSIIGAKMGNGRGICGVFPKCRLYGASLGKNAKKSKEELQQTVDEDYKNIFTLECCLTYLIVQKNCKVVNCSFGYDEESFAASRNVTEAKRYIRRINNELGSYLELLLDRGKEFVIVVAAGNQNSINKTDAYLYIKADEGDSNGKYGYIRYKPDEFHSEYVPYSDNWKEGEYAVVSKKYLDWGNVGAEYTPFGGISDKNVKDHIIVVGANRINKNGTYSISSFSNGGDRFSDNEGGVDLTAPGEEIWGASALIEKTDKLLGRKSYTDYVKAYGTSLSAPFVSGIAGMIYSVNPALTGAQVKNIICSSVYGSVKMPDSEAALKLAVKTEPMTTSTTETTTETEPQTSTQAANYKKMLDSYLGVWEVDEEWYNIWGSDLINIEDLRINLKEINNNRIAGSVYYEDNGQKLYETNFEEKIFEDDNHIFFKLNVNNLNARIEFNNENIIVSVSDNIMFSNAETKAFFKKENKSKSSDIIEEYSTVLQKENDLYYNKNVKSYYLYDINKDGIYELIVQFGNSDTDMTADVWTYHDDKACYCGDINLLNTVLYSVPDNNGLMLDTRDMTFQNIKLLTLNDLKTTTSDLLPTTNLSELTDDENNVQWHSPSEFYAGAEELNSHQLNDTAYLYDMLN